MRKAKWSVLLAVVLVGVALTDAHALSSYKTNFESTYPSAKGSAIDSCNLCHPGGNTGSLNNYANDFASAGHAFGPIESKDSDGDGSTNITEINAKTFPGDASSKPAPVPTNQPPVANAGPDQTVAEGKTVTLDGSNCTDPDNGIATYAWKQTSGPAVTLSNASMMKPTFVAPSAGSAGVSLTFQLTVTDKAGLTDMDTCIVNVTPSVTPPTNKPPVANAGPDQTVDSGSPVTLSGANSTDPDDGIASYLWKQTTGPAVKLSSTTDIAPTFTAPSVGSTGAALTFQLTVTDNSGLKSADTCIINVSPTDGGSTNLPPIADAGPKQTAVSRSTVTLNGANSSDPNGDALTYQWKQIRGRSVTLSSATGATPSFTAPNVKRATSLMFRLTVTDAAGMKSTDKCIVQVKPVKKSSHSKRHEREDDDD